MSALSFSLHLLPDDICELSWKHQEQTFRHKIHHCDRFLRDLMHHSLTLERWKGHVSIEASNSDVDVDFSWMDVFEDNLSYQWIEYGSGGRQRGGFKRLAYGKVDILEFMELIYATVTDLAVTLGTSGISALTGKPFPFSLYKRLAKQLRRPYQLPEEGDVTEKESEEMDEAGWEWESDDGEEEAPPMSFGFPEPSGLSTKSEFLKLGSFIKTQPEDNA
jgi:hypothetical protein